MRAKGPTVPGAVQVAKRKPGHRKSITILRGFAETPPDIAKPKRMVFDFFAKPVSIEGSGKAEKIIVERTELDEKGAARGTGETYEVDDSMNIRASIGASLFWTTPIGPLRFNFAKALKKEDYDEEQSFDLTISTRF